MKRIGIEFAVSISWEEVSLLLRAVNDLINESKERGDPTDALDRLKNDLEDILYE